jgi:hypothetical protein
MKKITPMVRLDSVGWDCRFKDIGFHMSERQGDHYHPQELMRILGLREG